MPDQREGLDPFRRLRRSLAAQPNYTLGAFGGQGGAMHAFGPEVREHHEVRMRSTKRVPSDVISMG